MLEEMPRAESLCRWMALFSDERSIFSITKPESIITVWLYKIGKIINEFERYRRSDVSIALLITKNFIIGHHDKSLIICRLCAFLKLKFKLLF